MENHFNVPWRNKIKVTDGMLGIYFCTAIPREKKVWSVETEFDINVLSVVKKSPTINIEHTFDNSAEFDGWGYVHAIKISDVKKNYLINGNLIIDVHVKVFKMCGIEKPNLRNFDESMREFSDVVLSVDDEKFFVSKLFLASQSTYFETLFLREFKESEKSEITLKDVDSNDFQNFLELLYGESSIYEDTVEGIVKLADMYDAKLAIRKCEEYLINESDKALKEKLQMAKKYNLEKLKVLLLKITGKEYSTHMDICKLA